MVEIRFTLQLRLTRLTESDKDKESGASSRGGKRAREGVSRWNFFEYAVRTGRSLIARVRSVKITRACTTTVEKIAPSVISRSIGFFLKKTRTAPLISLSC
jgi:hypothetical protein